MKLCSQMKATLGILFLFLTLCVFFLETPHVFAEALNESPATLDAVVVTAEKKDLSFQTGDVDTEQTPAFFSVISKEQFEGKMEDLSEVIERETGIQVRQSGGLGSFSSVSLRGSSGEQVMVFLDGILLNDASGGGVDLSNIALSDVEAIEIYRGITPVNFGKASIGGVVNIRTHRSKKGLNASASSGYGSFNTRKISGFVNQQLEKWSYLISADYMDADNDFEMSNDNGTEYNTTDDRYEKRNNAQVDQSNVLAKLGYDFTDFVRIEFMNQWFSKDQNLPSWNNRRTTKTNFDTRRNIATLKLTADDVGALHLNTQTRLDYSWKEEKYDDSQGHIGMDEQLSAYTTGRYGLNFFAEWLSDLNALSLTLDAQHETYKSEDLLKVKNPSDSSRLSFNLGLQDSMTLLGEKLIITPAIRYTFIKDELESDTSRYGLPLEGISRNENYLSPQIGLKYRFFHWLTFKSNLARYVREPSFFELFGDRGLFLPNFDLEAEEGINYDAGFEIAWQPSDAWLERFSFKAVYFGNTVDNRIVRTYSNSRGTGKSENIPESTIDGFELGFNLDILKYFSLMTNATWQDTKNGDDTPGNNAKGKDLAGHFKEAYMGRFEGRYGGFKAYAEYIREKGLYYDTPNLLKAGDKEEINAGFSWLFRSFLLSFEAKNMGDDQYEEFNGYPLPGRSYFVSLKYSF
ncbi:MAG: hypothetical protein B6245_19660 [Desulfobacteraceae bacterium 4572_88]|nr:MAG: hypothetical protein B6245_19660 [Desulfobacteraceae bacterium 4572_88]RLC16618.1 MAG: hypothetical protein DRI57_10970 [Deltaproteobacteria bacterium]